jgi:hypothetical protein
VTINKNYAKIGIIDLDYKEAGVIFVSLKLTGNKQNYYHDKS